MRKLLPFVVLLLLGSLSACDRGRLFEQNTDLAKGSWPVKVQPIYSFEITDTTQAYDLFINVRNAADYPYNNLYVRHYLYAPDSTLLNTALHNLHLSDPKTGKPFGSGMGDLFDHRIRFIRNVKFTRSGRYSIKLHQYMRVDPLPGIMSVGFRIAEAQTQN